MTHTKVRARSAAVALSLLLTCLLSNQATAQVHLSTGVLIDPEPSVGSTRGGPLLSVAFSTGALGIPLFVQADLARTDFTSLGQDYHHNYTLLTLGTEWFPFPGKTRVGVRLGLGAVGEFEVVETHPSQSGGDNWIEAVVPGLVVERRLGGGRRLVLVVSDYILGPWQAAIDPSEGAISHRITVSAGVRF